MRIIVKLLRLRLLGVTLATALVGTVSVRSSPSWRIALVLAVAVLFHIASYVLNDVADIEVDRANPNRAQSPLVASDVRLRTAAFVGIVAVIAALAVDRVAAGSFGVRTLALAVAFAGLIGYDFAGKRVPFPPLTDAIQGVGWGALACYGALAAGVPSPASFLVAGYLVVAVTFVNGVHGALRDVASDLRSKASTTAILLGARPGTCGPLVSRALSGYAWAFQGTLIAIVVAAVAVGGPRGLAGWSTSIIAVVLIVAASLPLHWMLSPGDPFRRKLMGGAHIVAGFGAAACVATVKSGPLPVLCVLGVLVLPLLPTSWRRTAAMTRAQLTEVAN
jgi:4-hydroxybenzoate polyprenyltransferase